MRESSALLPVYAPVSRSVRCAADGSWLVDENGEEWLDAYGGHAVAVHRPQSSRRGARHRRAGRASCCSTRARCRIRSARGAGREAGRRSVPIPLARVFFCNSGAEANENALHLARKHTGRQTIVSRGRGLAWPHRGHARRAPTGRAMRTAPGAPGIPLSRKVPFDDIAALEAAVDDSVAAVIVEPVQGLAGARDCSTGVPAGRAADLQRARRGADLRRGAVRRRPVRRLQRRRGVSG